MIRSFRHPKTVPMKQLYSRVYSPFRILNHIANCRPGRKFFKNGMTSAIPYSALFIPVMLLAAVSFSSAQNKAGNSADVKSIAGTWLLKDALVSVQQQRVDSIAKENSFWADHINLGIPVKIESDGALTYSMDQKPAAAKVKIEGGNLIFYFSGGKVAKVSDKGNVSNSGSGVSYTVYQYTLHGRELVISREDPEFSEKYVFKRQ